MNGRECKLLGLHDSPAHTVQQKAWQEDLKAFERLKADDEEELRRVRGEAYQVATLYVMFQGVIFTAVSQPHLLSCRLWWSPVFLSLAVAAATLLAIADKFYSMGELQEDIVQSDLMISSLLNSINCIWDYGADLDLDLAQSTQEIPRTELAGLHFVLSRHGIFALLFLAGFSIHIAIFSMKTLCRNCPACSAP